MTGSVKSLHEGLQFSAAPTDLIAGYSYPGGVVTKLRIALNAFWTAVLIFTSGHLWGQSWDPGSRLSDFVSTKSEGKLHFGVEQRERYESRTGTNFGKDPDITTGLVRTRLSVGYEATSWLKFSAMMQDSRAPWYGSNAPSSVRDSADLHEGYVELFSHSKTGFGLTAGRMMLSYGDGRLIGTPQWGNVSRTYDHGRIYYRTRRVRIEALLVSPVKVQPGDFNRPVLGDRLWGTYNTFKDLWRKNALEVYLLRRDQNRQGGYTAGSKAAGTDKLGLNTFGFRVAGPVTRKTRYSVEAVAQNGKVGPASHRGTGWVSSVTRRWEPAGRPLDISGEYKFASGARNPKDTALSRTFDQLYAANHDKFGHQDLFGWRNINNLRSLATYGISKKFALNFMYNNYWLASAYDSLYNGSGKAIARSANGSAGTHVGQDTDLFVTYKYRHFQLGAGYGHLFMGSFLRTTTPGASPSYVYIFHTYSL